MTAARQPSLSCGTGLPLCAGLLALLLISRPAPAGDLLLSTGMDVSTGNYGDVKPTTIVSPTLTVKYRTEDWVIGASGPYLRSTGPDNVVPGLGTLGGTSQTLPSVTRVGVGDIVIWGSRTILTLDATGTSIDLTGKIHFGTASAAQGLGTGENDYSLMLEATQPIAPDANLFASFGRRFTGSPPGVSLLDVWYGSIGGDYKLQPGWTVNFSLDMRQPSSVTSGRQEEVTGSLTWRVAPPWKIQIYAVKGFASGSPAVGGGVVLTWQYSF